jgi:thioredoxin 2
MGQLSVSNCERGWCDVVTAYVVPCSHCGTANRIPADKEGKSGRCGNCRKELAPVYVKPVQLTDSTFDAFISRYNGPVLVEFWAPWCPHCRSFEATVHKVAGTLAGSAAVVQVNTQENPVLAGRFGVRSIPVLVVLKQGKAVGQLAGVQSSEAIAT